MHKIFIYILLGLFVTAFASCDKETESVYTPPQKVRARTLDESWFEEHPYIEDTLLMKEALMHARYSPYKDMTVGIFGGSHTCHLHSEVGRTIMSNAFRWDVVTYGISGQGYAYHPKWHSVIEQVDGAEPKDIYILWQSTNDFRNDAIVGSPSDYTEKDSWDSTKLNHASAGLNYCIKKLREKNPSCKIFIFGSMKFFERKGGYDNTAEDYNQAGYLYSDYIAVQRAIAQREGIPFFDQFSLLPVDEDNFHRYYLSDHLHLNAHGYTNITYHQVEFMATH